MGNLMRRNSFIIKFEIISLHKSVFKVILLMNRQYFYPLESKFLKFQRFSMETFKFCQKVLYFILYFILSGSSSLVRLGILVRC